MLTVARRKEVRWCLEASRGPEKGGTTNPQVSVCTCSDAIQTYLMSFGGGSHCRREAPHESGMSVLPGPGRLLIILPNLEQVREEASNIPEPISGVLPILIFTDLYLYADIWSGACTWQV